MFLFLILIARPRQGAEPLLELQVSFSPDPERRCPKASISSSALLCSAAVWKPREKHGRVVETDCRRTRAHTVLAHSELCYGPSCLFIRQTVFLPFQSPKWTWSEEGVDEEKEEVEGAGMKKARMVGGWGGELKASGGRRKEGGRRLLPEDE